MRMDDYDRVEFCTTAILTKPKKDCQFVYSCAYAIHNLRAYYNFLIFHATSQKAHGI